MPFNFWKKYIVPPVYFPAFVLCRCCVDGLNEKEKEQRYRAFLCNNT